jgi:hypothetical protein
MPTRTALRSAPTTSDLRAFLAGLSPDTDAAILRAVAIIDALKAPYASASRRAHVRRVARELVVLAVRGESTDPLALGAARSDADARLSAAVDTTVDCDGSTFYEEIRSCIREIRATTDSMRHAARDARVAAERKPDLSHMSQLERDYHREVRAMFDAQRAA